MDAERDTPTSPGRRPTETEPVEARESGLWWVPSRKIQMQILATAGAAIVVVCAAWQGQLSEAVMLAALGVMGLTGAGGQAGNVGEHFAKSLPGIAEGIARALRGRA